MVLYSIQLFLHYILFGENCNQNVKVEKMVIFVKTFDYYYQSQV